MIIDTGTPRSLSGHAVSGAAAGLISAGLINYQCYKDDKISQTQALSNTLKATAQGALIGVCSIGIANALGSQKSVVSNVLESSAYLLVGMAGSYAIAQMNFCNLLEGVLNDNDR